MTDYPEAAPALFLVGQASSTRSAALVNAARAHLDHLKAAGVLGDGFGLQAAIVTELAASLAEPGKGYGKAQVAQALGQALDRLPVVVDSDAWDTWSTLVGRMSSPAAPVAPARYATQPTPGAAHDADGVALVAAMLGKPLMPWQYQVARVATERTPDGSRYKHRRVVVTVPRQAGKTTLLAAIFVHQVLTRTNCRVWMTAQTGIAATARWNDLRKLVTDCKQLAPFVAERRSTGSSSLGFPRSDSHINPFAPTPESLHGYTFDRVAVDEAFAFTADEGSALLGAITPAMVTIPDRQMWVTSTAGGPESTWLRSLVEHGRATVGAPDQDVAYFEWSGDQAEIDDPAGYLFHPALGYTIATVDDLMEAAESLPPSERERAFRNRWVESINEPLLPLALLRACSAQGEHQSPPPADGTIRVAIGFDVDYDAGTAAIYAAWEDGDLMHGRQLAHHPGMDWVYGEILELVDVIPGAQIVTPPDGPSAEIVGQLAKVGVDVTVLDSNSWALACGALHRRIKAGTIALGAAEPDTDLQAAIVGAATRPLGDAWAVSRKRSTAPVSSWCALAVAMRTIDQDGVATFPIIEGSK